MEGLEEVVSGSGEPARQSHQQVSNSPSFIEQQQQQQPPDLTRIDGDFRGVWVSASGVSVDSCFSGLIILLSPRHPTGSCSRQRCEREGNSREWSITVHHDSSSFLVHKGSRLIVFSLTFFFFFWRGYGDGILGRKEENTSHQQWVQMFWSQKILFLSAVQRKSYFFWIRVLLKSNTHRPFRL